MFLVCLGFLVAGGIFFLRVGQQINVRFWKYNNLIHFFIWRVAAPFEQNLVFLFERIISWVFFFGLIRMIKKYFVMKKYFFFLSFFLSYFILYSSSPTLHSFSNQSHSHSFFLFTLVYFSVNSCFFQSFLLPTEVLVVIFRISLQNTFFWFVSYLM